MLGKGAAGAAVALMLFAGQAAAAESVAHLNGVSGNVLVTQAGAASRASEAMNLSTGARIVADKGAQAQLKYSDGCVITLAPGAMTTVGAHSPCATSGLVQSGKPMQLFGEGSELLTTLVIGGAFVGVFFALKEASTTNHQRAIPHSP